MTPKFYLCALNWYNVISYFIFHIKIKYILNFLKFFTLFQTEQSTKLAGFRVCFVFIAERMF